TELKMYAPRVCIDLDIFHPLLNEPAQTRHFYVEFAPSGFDHVDVEHVVDDPDKPVGGLFGLIEVFPLPFRDTAKHSSRRTFSDHLIPVRGVLSWCAAIATKSVFCFSSFLSIVVSCNVI